MALDVSSIQLSSPTPIDGARHAPPNPEHVAGLASTPEGRGAKPVQAVPEDLKTTIRDLQRVSETFDRRLSFSLNEKLGQVVVKVIDNDTDKVVREIPPAELQHVYERIREVIGLLFDKSA
jgi:flagellar protein FlaG